MQEVQARMRVFFPPMMKVAFWRFGRHVLLVFLLEWLTLLPDETPLPQISHFLLIVIPRVSWIARRRRPVKITIPGRDVKSA
jgi:hypothetical protein